MIGSGAPKDPLTGLMALTSCVWSAVPTCTQSAKTSPRSITVSPRPPTCGRTSGRTDSSTSSRRAKRLLETRFPAARVYGKAGLRQVFTDEAANFQRLIFALLSLAILISVLGVANTISLSIYERTREIAILRAIGATRGQIRSIVHQEGVVTSLVGGSVGAVLGTALGGVFVASVSSSGFLFAFPLPVMALIVAATLLAGFLAAVLPARRAADARIIEAIADA